MPDDFWAQAAQDYQNNVHKAAPTGVDTGSAPDDSWRVWSAPDQPQQQQTGGFSHFLGEAYQATPIAGWINAVKSGWSTGNSPAPDVAATREAQALGPQKEAEAEEALQQGNYGRAAASAIESLPFVGPVAQGIENKIQGKDWSGLAGQTVGTAATLGALRGTGTQTAADVGEVTKEAVKGGIKGGAQLVSHRYVPIPASAAGYISGKYMAGTPGAIIGAAAPIVVGAIKRGREALQNIRGLSPEAEAETEAAEPFRPNPAIAKKTAFGGPTEPEYSPPGQNIPRKSPSATQPQQTQQPFRTNPNIAKTISYGGSTEPDYSPAPVAQPTGWKPPEQSLVPEAAEETPKFERFQVNPRIQRNIRFGGSADDESASVSAANRQLRGRRLSPTPNVQQPEQSSAQPAPSQPPPVTPPGMVTVPQGKVITGVTPGYEDVAVQKAQAIAEATARKAQNIARHIRAKGYPADELDPNNPLWQNIAKEAGAKEPGVGYPRGISPTTIGKVIEELKKLPASPPNPPPQMAKGGVVTSGASVEDRVRGSANVPLSPEGTQEAIDLGKHMAKNGFGRRGDTITPGVLDRSKQTAALIAQSAPGAKMMPPDGSLDTWRLGNIEGQPSDQAKPQIEHFIKNPDEVPPPGPVSSEQPESLNQFKQRALPPWKARYQQYLRNPNSRHIFISHGRGARLLQAWVKKGMPDNLDLDPNELLKDDDRPADVWRLAPGHAGVPKMQGIDRNSNSRIKQGLFLVRHASTPWNKPADSEPANAEWHKGGVVKPPTSSKGLQAVAPLS